jgi:diguanylate cyclase (GGDEF)-like protein
MGEIRRASKWEVRFSESLGLLHLSSLRDRILAFAVLAALVPSLITAFLSYEQNRRALNTRIGEELRTAGNQGAREVGMWYQQRLFDLKVFTSSYEIAENLTRPDGVARVRAYLRSVMGRVEHLDELVVLDRDGRVVASNLDVPGPIGLPSGWEMDVRAGAEVAGPPVRGVGGVTSVTLAVPIFRQGTGTVVGTLAARLRLDGLVRQLAPIAPSAGGLTMLAADGAPILTVEQSGGTALRSPMNPQDLDALRADTARVVRFRTAGGDRAMAALHAVPRLPWLALAEIGQERAFEQVRRLRNTTIAIVFGILFGVGWIGYRLGLLIVRPLDRLAAGAANVADGDLSVDVPVVGSGEVATLTQVFNDMVRRLREGRAQLNEANESLRIKNEELARLSVTDQLTGLFNRRRLMEVLEAEVNRSKRHDHPFSILIMDVDHFKKFNDAYGHLAGDRVLAGLGDVLRETTREIDTPARFGGEEFMAVLPETDLEAAVEVAERIRETLGARIFEGRRVTLSIGAAQFPIHGDDGQRLIAAADAALYRAKDSGRNRVERAGAAA